MILHRHLLIHVEWHRGYGLLPRVRVRLEPQPGDVVKDGDHYAKVVRCPECSGDGVLLAEQRQAVATAPACCVPTWHPDDGVWTHALTCPQATPKRETQRIGGDRTIREEWQARRPGEPFPLDVDPQLAHIAAPVDLTLPKRPGLGRTACALPLDGDVVMAMTPAGISCPTCAAAYVADPSLLGPT